MTYEVTTSKHFSFFRSLRKNIITKLKDGVFSGLTNLQYLYVLHKIYEDIELYLPRIKHK